MRQGKKRSPWSVAVGYFGITVLLVVVMACNNPFKTRDPEVNPNPGGVAIQPANSAENVLYNMKVSFENLSVQDYLDTFSEDFVFVPDPEDSLEYENEFRSSWNKQKERDFMNNISLSIQSDTLTVNYVTFVTANYEYKPGQDMYEYNYVLEVVDHGKKNELTIRGRAWIYLKEYPDGKWYIYRWIDHKVQATMLTWGVLRALYL
ncbi:hypothetical protein LLG96_01000 [bacterium]|nr:hypothetical protein [bacterium]